MKENQGICLIQAGKGDNKNKILTPVAGGSPEQLAVYSLVLSAVGINHLQNKKVILVQPEDSRQATHHIEAYRAENKGWPPPPSWLTEQQQTDQPPTVLVMGGMFLFYYITGPWQADNPWFKVGAVDSLMILGNSEWWRLITALTLHADTVHLLGNCLLGGIIIHLLCKTTGYGTGWLALILAGGCGNFINIGLRDAPHLSVGFSTSIFAAIGILCGLRFKKKKSSFMDVFIPMGAGLALLALLGSQGEQTDLGAHLFGFACGIGFGLLVKFTRLIKRAGNSRLQKKLFSVSIVIVAVSWLLAARQL
jgi:membrane associated rhomboid family serine protease